MIPTSKIEGWLEEDLGHHDVTNQVPGETRGRLVAKEPGVAAGVEAAVAVFEYLGVAVEREVAAGDRIEPGDALLRTEGPARETLRGERVAVNIAGHASGIATKTREAVERVREAAPTASEQASGEGRPASREDDRRESSDKASGEERSASREDDRRESSDKASEEERSASREAVTTGSEQASGEAASRDISDPVRIACTRKTTPGLRGVEKRAVAAAGGDTHRLDLSHMVMVKDNHVAEMGLEGAVEQFRERASFATKIEVEVEIPEDAPRAAEAGADVVLLDNMDPETTATAVELLRESHPDVLAEASGGITVADVPDYAATGVDIISMGSLTHSADTLDLSFRTG